jgi:hypothetical protein
MTPNDAGWFTRCYHAGLVKDRMLEVGSAKVQGVPNLCDIARDLGVSETKGADISSGIGVDVIFDFGIKPEKFKEQWSFGKFSTVSVFNVLEHTFDPITVLTNALSCVESEGTLLVITPSIWPIHNFPFDYNRLLPDWYRTFAERNSIKLVDQHFCWLSEFGTETIGKDSNSFPTYISRAKKISPFRYWTSRGGHKLLNTYGRSHWANHSAIGAAFYV